MMFDWEHKIVIAACKSPDGTIVMGLRHADCHNRDTKTGEGDGFICNQGKFHDREDAFVIADKAGQIKFLPEWNIEWHKERGTRPRLFSENLY